MDIDTTNTDANRTPNWRHVGIFLGLTFGLTYLLNLIIYLRGGLKVYGHRCHSAIADAPACIQRHRVRLVLLS